MGATKLDLYNGALLELGVRRLASLTEETEARRVLDDYYTKVLDYCLEAGSWNFAIRSVQIDSDPDVETEFGLQYVFSKPDDWVRTLALSGSDTFYAPLLDTEYKDETEYWLSSSDPIFVRYISNDVDFGLNLSRWPGTFTRFVELELASRACRRLTSGSGDKERIDRDLKIAKRNALNKDVMNEGIKFAQHGSWVASRYGGSRNNRGLWPR
jgi:hypothetical protein